MVLKPYDVAVKASMIRFVGFLFVLSSSFSQIASYPTAQTFLVFKQRLLVLPQPKSFGNFVFL